MGSILHKGLISVFLATFALVFVLFTMVEPYITCEDTGNIIPACRAYTLSGDFILGVAIVMMLFLVDMALVYLLISEVLL